MLQFNFNYNNLPATVNLEDNICYLLGDSGTGKTFIFSIIDYYCSINQIKCVNVNYAIASAMGKDLISICNRHDIVILDDADLYITNDILKQIKAKHILVGIKSQFGLTKADAGLYRVKYTEDSIDLRRKNSNMKGGV